MNDQASLCAPCVPDVADLREALAWQAERHAEAVAIDFVGGSERQSRSFSQIAQKARALADGPLAGLSCNARVLLAVRPGPAFAEALFGCLYAGVVGVPIGTGRLRDLRTKLHQSCQASCAELVLTERALEKDVQQGAPGFPIALVDDVDLAHDIRPPARPAADLAYVQFTSGSTGMPKMVAIGQDNVLANLARINAGFDIRAHWSGVTWLPPHHDMGLMAGVLLPLICGHRTTSMAPGDFARNPLEWLALVSKTGAEVSGAPDFAYDLCARRLEATPDALPDTTDLSRWRVAFCGAEPIRATTLTRFAEQTARFGFDTAAFLPCYGMAESTVYVASASSRASPIIRHFDATDLSRNTVVPSESGRALVACGTDHDASRHGVRICDETGESVPSDRVGEIHVKGPSVARGYLGAGSLSTEPFSQEGWLPTGDLGFVSEGQLFICGRSKDLIIRNGRNHAANDLEACAMAVTDRFEPGWTCLAFAHMSETPLSCGPTKPDPAVETTEQIVLLLEPPRRATCQGQGPRIAAAIAAELVRERGVSPDCIAMVRTGGLPRTTSGKLRRAGARDMMAAGTLKVTAVSDPVAEPVATDTSADQLTALIAQTLDAPPSQIDLKLPLTAQGADSLKVLELQMQLEKVLNLHIPLEHLLADLPAEQLLTATAQDECAMCLQDAQLPSGLSPSTAARGPNMLLTGATGLVGRHVLEQALRDDTYPQIYVLHRASARQRLQDWLSKRGLTDMAQARVQLIEADLAEPDLGVSKAWRARLADTVGTIVHCAADLSFALPYTALRASNVAAVVDLIRLMGQGCGKRLVALSSAGILEAPTGAGAVSETGPLPDPARLPLSYARTKWAADALVRAAQDAGFDATLIRPPWIVEGQGDTVSGAATAGDFLARFVHSCCLSGTVPLGPFHWNVVNADFVARASLHAARQDTPKVLHTGLPEPIPADGLLRILQTAGLPVAGVPAEDWLRDLQHTLSNTPTHPLAPLRHLVMDLHGRPSAFWPYTLGKVPVMDSRTSLAHLNSVDIRPTLPTLALSSTQAF